VRISSGGIPTVGKDSLCQRNGYRTNLSSDPPSGGSKEHNDRRNILNFGQLTIHTGALMIRNRIIRLCRIKERSNINNTLLNIRIHRPRTNVINANPFRSKFLRSSATKMLHGSFSTRVRTIQPCESSEEGCDDGDDLAVRIRFDM
jgi:hypothetical protein